MRGPVLAAGGGGGRPCAGAMPHLTPCLIKVRKSTWKERAEDGKDMSWMGSSLAVNHKDKGLGSHVKKRAPKKKKGMPW